MSVLPDDGLELHRRLVAGSKTASAQLASAFLAELFSRLRGRHRQDIADDLLHEAAEDAILALIKNPLSFKPEKQKSLINYLVMSAEGDLRNALQKQPALKLVELPDDIGNSISGDDSGSTRLEVEEELRLAEPLLRAVCEGLDEKECECLMLKLDGERKTERFAAVLGIEHLSQSEQQEQVKKVKDKLEARIRRERSRHVEPS